MNEIVMYSSGTIFDECQPGGVKRFIELAKSFRKCKAIHFNLVSQDETMVAKSEGFNNYIELNPPQNEGINALFPPEMRIVLSNGKQLNEIKKIKCNELVVFDVPPAIGLVLSGFRNIVLMIRKDLIGYEKTINHRLSLYPKILFLWMCESLCLMRSSMIVCQCEYDKKQLIKRHPLIAGTIAKKTRVLINNVNPSWIENKDQSNVVEFELGEKKKFRICFIGNFDTPRKGHQLLLDASERILNEGNEIEFILIGGGDSFDEYRNKYENNNIIFTGKLNNPASILKQCDLLVVPSYADSCPNTIMEALYNDVPVIGSKAGGIPEILVDKESLFELTPDSLSSLIIDLKNSSDKLKSLREKQRERKRDLTFDWGEKMMNLILYN